MRRPKNKTSYNLRTATKRIRCSCLKGSFNWNTSSSLLIYNATTVTRPKWTRFHSTPKRKPRGRGWHKWISKMLLFLITSGIWFNKCCKKWRIGTSGLLWLIRETITSTVISWSVIFKKIWCRFRKFCTLSATFSGSLKRDHLNWKALIRIEKRWGMEALSRKLWISMIKCLRTQKFHWGATRRWEKEGCKKWMNLNLKLN